MQCKSVKNKQFCIVFGHVFVGIYDNSSLNLNFEAQFLYIHARAHTYIKQFVINRPDHNYITKLLLILIKKLNQFDY